MVNRTRLPPLLLLVRSQHCKCGYSAILVANADQHRVAGNCNVRLCELFEGETPFLRKVFSPPKQFAETYIAIPGHPMLIRSCGLTLWRLYQLEQRLGAVQLFFDDILGIIDQKAQ